MKDIALMLENLKELPAEESNELIPNPIKAGNENVLILDGGSDGKDTMEIGRFN